MAGDGYRSLLVPLDGSSFAEEALACARYLAQTSNARLCLAHVHVPVLYVYLDGLNLGGIPTHARGHALDDDVRTTEQSYLTAIQHQLQRTPELDVTVVLLDGPPVHTLLEYATTQEIDLIVLATHGRGAVSRLWLGSVADGLLRHSSVPLLFIRHRDATRSGQAPEFHHILLPLDGSSLAEQIVEPAVQLGRLMPAEFTLVRVVDPVIVPGFAPLSEDERLDATAEERICADATHYLERVAGRIADHGLPVQVRAIADSSPAHALLRAVRDYGADLIALATHGHGGVTRLLIGSVADKVLRGAKVPVLTMRPQPE